MLSAQSIFGLLGQSLQGNLLHGPEPKKLGGSSYDVFQIFFSSLYNVGWLREDTSHSIAFQEDDVMFSQGCSYLQSGGRVC